MCQCSGTECTGSHLHGTEPSIMLLVTPVHQNGLLKEHQIEQIDPETTQIKTAE